MPGLVMCVEKDGDGREVMIFGYYVGKVSLVLRLSAGMEEQWKRKSRE